MGRLFRTARRTATGTCTRNVVATAIRSAIGLPAKILGLTDRGLLNPGMVADITVFDANSFRDRATFDQPYLPATGVHYVLVNGTFAVYDGQRTGSLSGDTLRKLQNKF